MSNPFNGFSVNGDEIQARNIEEQDKKVGQPVDYAKIKLPPFNFSDDGNSRAYALRKKLAQKIQAIQI